MIICPFYTKNKMLQQKMQPKIVLQLRMIAFGFSFKGCSPSWPRESSENTVLPVLTADPVCLVLCTRFFIYSPRR